MELRLADYVVLVVEDLDRALAFYCEALGLRLGHRRGPFAQLVTGPTRIGLYTREAMATTLGSPLRPPDPAAPAFELGFKVADVDAACAELVEAGVAQVTPPTTRAWGQRTAYVRDPDGNLVELVQDLARPTGPLAEPS